MIADYAWALKDAIAQHIETIRTSLDSAEFFGFFGNFD